MNNKNDNIPVKKTVQSLSPEIISQIVENQSKELELRAQEISIQKQIDNNSLEFSIKALEAQVTDRRLQRDYNKYLNRNHYFFISLLIIAIVTVIIISLYLDKEAIAIEIIKAIVFILAGGIGGYGLGNKKDNGKNIDEKASIAGV